mgnify:CR=1 FL=1
MPQEDYIKKQLDKIGLALGNLLSELLRLKSKSSLDNRLEIANQVFKKELDYDIQVLLSMPNDKFLDLLIENDSLNINNLEKIADVFCSFVKESEFSDIKTIIRKVFHNISIY